MGLTEKISFQMFCVASVSHYQMNCETLILQQDRQLPAPAFSYKHDGDDYNNTNTGHHGQHDDPRETCETRGKPAIYITHKATDQMVILT